MRDPADRVTGELLPLTRTQHLRHITAAGYRPPGRCEPRRCTACLNADDVSGEPLVLHCRKLACMVPGGASCKWWVLDDR